MSHSNDNQPGALPTLADPNVRGIEIESVDAPINQFRDRGWYFNRNGYWKVSDGTVNKFKLDKYEHTILLWIFPQFLD